MSRVAVLKGGWSAEREVSLVSGAACATALRSLGHDVVEIDVAPDLSAVLTREAPEVVFNALHGRFGEDGCVQGLLEVLGLPYTHSGVLASALAMDKPMAKRVFSDAGLPLARGRIVSREEMLAGEPMDRPYVVKPINEGSSVGVEIVLAGDNVGPRELATWRHGDAVLVEEYIPGREIQVAVMGDEALGAIEIQAFGRFYDYDTKYKDGRARHIMPAGIPRAAQDEACDIALSAHRALGCRGVTRADLRYDDTGEGVGRFALLEVNTQPGMTPLSLVPEIAAYRGMDFTRLVGWILEDASCRR
ncbi:D-alanine--D-alanine ligase [Zavarzinia sp. CC-PAN008]|uniref:D-alanine--D-alanine ligase n=1 Tax=Zavarzinia sp. CC-PAN008 TaxID=3243332 RepID=UPI003F7457AF